MVGIRILEEVMFLGEWVSGSFGKESIWMEATQEKWALGVGGNMDWCLGVIR